MPTLYDTTTRQPVDLDGPELQQALASGKASYAADAQIPVYSSSPDDTGVYQVPATKLNAAMAQGYTVETPSQLAVRQYVDDPSNAGIKGSLKVAAGQALNQSFMGLPQMVYEAKGDPLEVAKWEALKKNNQLANFGGGAVGTVASFFNPLINPLFKGAAAAGELTSNIADKILLSGAENAGTRTAGQAAKDIAGNLISNTAGKAVEGAVIAAPTAMTEAVLSDKGLPDSFETAGESLLYGALAGGAFGVGGSLLDGGIAGAKGLKGLITPAKIAAEETPANIAAKIAKVVTGVSEKDVLDYAANPERINNIGQNYTKELLKDELDSHAEGFQQRAAQAAQAAKDVESQLNSDYANLKTEWAGKQAPREVADAIVGAQQSAKQQLGQMSDSLFDTLGNTNVTVSRDELSNLVNSQIERLKAPGQEGAEGAIFGQAAKTEAARLQGLGQDIATLPDQVNLSSVKQIIKQLDPDLNFSYGAGEFNDFTNKNGKEFRKFLNDKLRGGSPEAANILDQMSELSRTLSDVNDKFGTVEKAVSNTNNLFSPRGKLNREALENFSKVSGQDFLTPLKEFEDSKALLKRAKTEDLRAEVLPDAYQAYQKAKSVAEQTAQDYAPIARLTPIRTQSIVKNQSGNNANIMDRKAIEALGEMTGKDYNQMIKDLNTFDQFYRDRTNGSRRGLIYGQTLGALLGPAGYAIGAHVGGTLDVYGGALLKKAVDKSDNFRGLLLAEKKMKEVADKIDTIPNVLQRMTNKTGLSPSSMSLNAVERFISPKTAPNEKKPVEKINTRHENLQQMRQNLLQFTSNPQKAADEIGQITGPVSAQGAPKIGAAFNQKLSNAVNYLQSAVPKERIPQNPLAPKMDYKPSDAEVRQFERKLQVVQDPFSVLHDLEHGTLTKDHMEALQAVHPAIYSAMQDKVFKAAASGDIPPMSYGKRIKLSMFMGSPMDSSMKPTSILGYQQAYQQQDHSVDPSNKKQVNVASQMASDVQRLST